METNENDITITKYFTIISFHDCELMFFLSFMRELLFPFKRICDMHVVKNFFCKIATIESTQRWPITD